MDADFLKSLGLEVTDTHGVIEAELQLSQGGAFNPLTQNYIEKVKLQLVGDRMIAIDPPEFVGMPPINLAHLDPSSRLEELVVRTFNEQVLMVSRKSGELSALGLAPRVDPTTLQVTAELESGNLRLTIGADRGGHFRVIRVSRGENALTVPGNQSFELSEFRERQALIDYLAAMYQEELSPKSDKGPADPAIPFGALLKAFGAKACLPPKSTFEVLAEIRVGKSRYRFAAARVQGKTFRGLLAGASGKVWADRFELEELESLEALVAKVLEVPKEKVEIIA